MNQNQKIENKKVKHQGPIRWNAIIPFTLLCSLVGLYMHFFFDGHLRRGIEWIGYKAIGSEVNISELNTSFFNASFVLRKLEITDAEKPDFNSVEIGDIRFSMLWDALLRAKAVVNEIAVEKISFGTKRDHRGKVKPPEPPSEGSNISDKVKNEAIDYIQDEYSQNILGDIANLLKGGDANKELEKIRDSLPSKAKLQAFEQNFKTKQSDWDKRIKSLPQGPEIKALGDRLGKVKIKDFKSPQEVADSVREFETIFKEADQKIKLIQTSSDDFQRDLKQIQAELADLDKQIKEDLKTLETRFRIPKLDPAVISRALFQKYLGPYLGKLNQYKTMAYKYIPPKMLEKNKSENTEEVIQPRVRDHGISYEFGRPGNYPLFWLKKTSISSQAGSSPGAGNISGQISDITSNQYLIGRPTVLDISGGFPDNQIDDFKVKMTLDNTKEKSIIDYLLSVGSYPIEQKNLVESGEVNLTMTKAIGKLNIQGSLIGFQDFQMKLDNDFKNLEYSISSKEASIGDVFKNIFREVKTAHLTASMSGVLPKVNLSITSDIGELLEKAFNKELQARIAELRVKVQKTIDETVGKHKEEIERQLNKSKAQIESEIKKIQGQVESQKKMAEGKEQQVKKDAENQAKKQLENEGQKKLDELKKKFGF